MEEFNNPKINFRILDIIEGVSQLDKEFVGNCHEIKFSL